MLKELNVEVDQSTWPSSGSPAFPSTFVAGTSVEQIDVLGLLALLGFLTTPTTALGMSLSEHWAWVRYFNAISDENKLKITPGFAQLDPHQKTILSDDFGMAVPMYWLAQKLQLEAVCDGFYYAQRFADIFNVAVTGHGQRGPRKTADFVCVDVQNRWHVIECKGTQTSDAARERQFQHQTQTGQASGAIVQKRTIVFPPASAGQRLAAGLVVAIEGTRRQSSLKVVDPQVRPRKRSAVLQIDEKQFAEAQDPIVRAMTARALIAVGLPTAGTALASPNAFVEMPGRRDESTRRRSRRDEIVRTRDEIARRELIEAENDVSGTRTHEGVRFRARTQTINMPSPTRFDEKRIAKVRITSRLNMDVLRFVRERGFTEEPIVPKEQPILGVHSQLSLQRSGTATAIRFGSLFNVEVAVSRRRRF